MTYKSYIVANNEQELNVLNKLENNGFKWVNIEALPTKFRFSESFLFNKFPYVISAHEDIKRIGWSYYPDDDEGNVVYDGRKEEKKYKVTQGFMNELIKWRYADWRTPLTVQDLACLPVIISSWCLENESPIEDSNRILAIIQWLSGEDVFEVEAPHKFVVRSDKKDHDGYYAYVAVENDMTTAAYTFVNATKFDTREEAQEWANSHQVVIEIDAEGNEYDEFYEVRYSNSKLVSHINKTYVFRVDLMEED